MQLPHTPSQHEDPVGDGQPMLDQRMGGDELLHIADSLQDGVLAFALACTAFRDAVYVHLGSAHIRSTCAQVVRPADATHACIAVPTHFESRPRRP